MANQCSYHHPNGWFCIRNTLWISIFAGYVRIHLLCLRMDGKELRSKAILFDTTIFYGDCQRGLVLFGPDISPRLFFATYPSLVYWPWLIFIDTLYHYLLTQGVTFIDITWCSSLAVRCRNVSWSSPYFSFQSFFLSRPPNNTIKFLKWPKWSKLLKYLRRCNRLCEK